MLAERPAIERRIITALDASPARVPVLVGGCGSGRTTLLQRLQQHLGTSAEYLDVERVATTPEGFLSSITAATHSDTPSKLQPEEGQRSARIAFDRVCRFLQEARTPTGEGVTFLLDEALEVRTFESFPGLRGALRELWATLCTGPNRFVLTTRFVTRTHRLFRDAPEQFEFIHIPPLTPAEVSTALLPLELGESADERLELSRILHALTDGRPLYLQLLAAATKAMGSGDPVSALASQLAPGTPLSMACRFSYELRLHRARGYGALKAILQVLSHQEPLTLTEIAQRLGRTPGSTKDYLSWLEDVDLLQVQQKRYSFSDPLLRLWVRLHGLAHPPRDEDLAREAQEYAVARFPYMEPALLAEPSVATPPAQERSWGMIEID
ncbi:MAG: hypothetical protein CL483_09205 [Acidobacteria bacterium]|nr:hypothetical protein [Acidobacteriota bacterium]